jgi:transcriptional regulator of acetoin/glycerol metabolism
VMATDSIVQPGSLGISMIYSDQFLLNRSLGHAHAKLQTTVIRASLERNRYNIKRSAAEIGVSRVTLYRLIHKHNIPITRPSL